MHKNYDVIIIGGGISGAIAGIAAARMGVRTLIVEKNGFLGGMLTAAGVGPMMTFHAGNTQVIQGITGEVLENLEKKGLSPGHIFDTTGYTYSVTPFDPEGMKRELETLYLEAGGKILFHTMLAEVETNNDRISRVTLCNKAGLTRYSAPIFIDASGDADLATWSGVEFTKGRPSDGQTQPLTMKVRMYNVDIAKVRRFIKENLNQFPRLKGDASIIDKAERLSIGGFVGILKQAQETGEISFSREDVLFFETNNRGEVIINTSRITGLDATDPLQLSSGEVEGRKQAAELVNFLRNRVPGFENAILMYTGPSVGIRSSRQIKGLYTLTKEDVLAAHYFDDSVVCNAYPIDIHSPTGESTYSTHLTWGKYYTIPMRSLLTDKIRNLVTVGRSISAEFEAQAAFRTTPSAGAIGHAGGCIAAIAAQSKCDTLQVPYHLVRDALLSQGAYLQPEPPQTEG